MLARRFQLFRNGRHFAVFPDGIDAADRQPIAIGDDAHRLSECLIENRNRTRCARSALRLCLTDSGSPSENTARAPFVKILDKPGIRSQCFNFTDGS